MEDYLYAITEKIVINYLEGLPPHITEESKYHIDIQPHIYSIFIVALKYITKTAK